MPPTGASLEPRLTSVQVRGMSSDAFGPVLGPAKGRFRVTARDRLHEQVDEDLVSRRGVPDLAEGAQTDRTTINITSVDVIQRITVTSPGRPNGSYTPFICCAVRGRSVIDLGWRRRSRSCWLQQL